MSAAKKIKLSLAQATTSVRNKFKKLRNEYRESDRHLEDQFRPITKRLGQLIDNSAITKPTTMVSEKEAAATTPNVEKENYTNDDEDDEDDPTSNYDMLSLPSISQKQQQQHQYSAASRGAYDDDANDIDFWSMSAADDDNDELVVELGKSSKELKDKKSSNKRFSPYGGAKKSSQKNNTLASVVKQLESENKALRRSKRLNNSNNDVQSPPQIVDDVAFYPLPSDSDSDFYSAADNNHVNNKKSKQERQISKHDVRTREEIKQQQQPKPKYKLIANERSARKRKLINKPEIVEFGEPHKKIGMKKAKYNLISGNRLDRKRKSNKKVRSFGEPNSKKPSEIKSVPQGKRRANQPIPVDEHVVTRSISQKQVPRKLTTRSSARTGLGLDFHKTKQLMNNHVGTCTPSLTYWDDPNELIERLRLLTSSTSAGHTGHNNEIISIIEELREANIIK